MSDSTPRKDVGSDVLRNLNALDLALGSQQLEEELRAFVTALLPLFDNVERLCRGLEAAAPDVVLGRAEALGLLADVAGEAVARIELEPVGRVGERTDRWRYEVIGTETRGDLPHGTVVDVVATGWVFRGVTLRPARVVASVAPGATAD